MIRVAALMDTRSLSGPAKQLLAVIPALREIGIEIVPVCFVAASQPETPFTVAIAALGIEYHLLRTTGRLDAALVRSAGALLRTIKPDIVQTHSYRPAFIAWCLRWQRPAWKWIGFFHGQTNEDLKVRLYNAVDRVVLRTADVLVVVASSQRARFRGLAQLRVIDNAALSAPPPAVEPAWCAAVHATERPRVGFIGRLSHEKGLDLLLEAFAQVPTEPLTPHLVVAGDGPERAASEAQVQQLGLAGRVSFLGEVTPAASLYPLLDLVVLPSRSEGMPNVLLEAARADVPVIATAVGAVPDVLRDNAGGEMVPAESVAALTQAMTNALRTGRTAEGSRGRAEICQRYSLERRAEAHRTLYRDLLGMQGDA